MRATEWQDIYFPFGVIDLECEISDVRFAIPDREVLACLRAERRLDGLFWSDKLRSNFTYLPATTASVDAVRIQLRSKTPWSAASFSLQPWGREAPDVAALVGTITVRAIGVIGEEQRSYSVEYSW